MASKTSHSHTVSPEALWSATIRGDRLMRWRPRCSRSKSVVAVSLGLGREPTEGSRRIHWLVKRSVRQRDPYYTVEDGWVVRRIGPHCERIELAQFPKRGDERLILRDILDARRQIFTPRHLTSEPKFCAT